MCPGFANSILKQRNTEYINIKFVSWSFTALLPKPPNIFFGIFISPKLSVYNQVHYILLWKFFFTACPCLLFTWKYTLQKVIFCLFFKGLWNSNIYVLKKYFFSLPRILHYSFEYLLIQLRLIESFQFSCYYDELKKLHTCEPCVHVVHIATIESFLSLLQHLSICSVIVCSLLPSQHDSEILQGNTFSDSFSFPQAQNLLLDKC